MKLFLSIFIILFLFSLLAGDIVNIEFIKTIDRAFRYIGSMAVKENYLYYDCEGGIQVFQIENDTINLRQVINKFGPPITKIKIKTNNLYLIDIKPFYTTYFKKFGFDNNLLSLENELSYDYSMLNLDFFINFDLNDDVVLLEKNYNSYSDILDINTFNYLGEILTGTSFVVKDTLLLVGCYQGSNRRLSIENIHDVFNPYEISSVVLPPNGDIWDFLFYNNFLILTRTNDIVIINLENINNPYIASVITNLPEIPSETGYRLMKSIVYENNLIIKGLFGKIWVYDISNIGNPQFLNVSEEFGFDNVGSLVAHENKIFFATSQSGIVCLDGNSLPEINALFNYGKTEIIYQSEYFPPFIIYDKSNKYYFNTDESEPTLHSFGPENTVSYFCHNDSLLFVLNENESERNIEIYKNIDDELVLLSTTPIYYENYECGFYSPYLLVQSDNPNGIFVYSITENYHLLEETFIPTLEYPYILKYNSEIIPDYFFILQGGNEHIKSIAVFEKEFPFSQVGEIDLTNFNLTPYTFATLLENDRMLIEDDISMPYHNFYLCEYDFPEQLTILAHLNTSGQNICKIYDGYFMTTEFFGGNINFYSWNNDEFTNIGSHSFDTPVMDIFLDEERSKLYTIGFYNISEYSYTETSADENLIIPPKNFFLSNFPNPFTASTTISFEFSNEQNKQNEQNIISIYNIKGQKIRQFSIPNFQFSIVWDGTDNFGKKVSPGIYLYQLKIDDKTIANKKCILLR